MKKSISLVLMAAALMACQAQMRTNEPQNPQPTSNPTQTPQPQRQEPTQQTSVQVPPPEGVPDLNGRVNGPSPQKSKSTSQQEGGPVVRTQPVPAEARRQEQTTTVTTRITKEVSGDCRGEEYVQSRRPMINKLDILFVVDTSHSLFKEREEVADGVDDFVAHFPKDLDYRIGILPAHGSTSQLSGLLYAPKGEEKVLSSTTTAAVKGMSPSEIRRALQDRFASIPPDGRESDRGELGLYSLNKALNVPHVSINTLDGFFRPDAALAVVFVADENDICAEYPRGVTPKVDPQGTELKAKVRDCKDITVSNLYARLKRIKGDVPFSVNGIVYTEQSRISNSDRSDAYSDENEIGYGYLDLIRYSNGLEIPLRSGSIAEGLGRIGEKMNLRLNTNLEFPLAVNDFRDEQLNVYVDGVKVTRETRYYHSETRRVHMHQAGRPGSRVKVEYCRTM